MANSHGLDPVLRTALEGQLVRLTATAEAQDFDPVERSSLHEQFAVVRHTIARRASAREVS